MPPKKKTQTQAKAIAKVGNEYPQLFREVNNLDEKDMLFKKVVEEENWYREVFAQERESKELSDPHVMLVDAHSNLDIFKAIKETPEESALPRVFPVQKELRRQPGEQCIVDAKEFERNFDVFTEAQLRFLNWDNVFAAGGAVLNALLPLPKEHAENNQARRNYYHNVAYKNSDIDLFIYGLDEEAANKKLDEIYFAVCESITAKAICFRSKHAVTIVSQYPYRHIQVVLRLYKSPAEILMGFDVDSCSVGYDGKKVYMTPRAHRALTHQYNAVDMTRRSPTYEQRLAKYADRGFAVLVPTLQRNKIDPQLFERRFDQLQGLAKLILLEKLSTPEGRQRYKNQQRLKKLRPAAEQKTSFIDHIGGKLGRQLDNDEYVRERLSDGGGDASDYSTVFLPWSPRWTAEKIRKLMYTKDMILNSKWYDPNKKIHTHPCFFGTAQEVARDCCGKCPPIPDELVDPDTPFVSGVLTWVTVNPGAQARIGSFHPITEGDWTEGAYVNEDMNKMYTAVNDDNTKALDAFLKEAKKQNLDDVVNTRDCLGRTPLMIAAFSNSVKCAKVLLKQGARISAKTGDGRNALMIAAQYGHLEIVKMIVQRGKDLVEENKNKAEAEKNKKSKKGGKKEKPKKKKKKGSDDEDEDEDDPMDEDEPEEEEEEENEEEENEEEEEKEEEDEDFTSIKSIVDQKKKEQQEAAEAADLVLQADKGDDTLDINATEWDLKFSALQFAIFFGWLDVVKFLIDSEADFKTDVPTDHGGYSNLTIAHFCSQVEVAKFLLEKGFPITHLDNCQENILHKAVRSKDLEFVTMLLEWNTKNNGGLNTNARNNSNQTALNMLIPVATSPAKPKSNSSMDVDKNDKDNETIDEEMFKLIKLLVEKGGAKVQYGEADLPTQQEQQVNTFNRGFGYNRHHNHHTGSIPSQIRNAFVQPLYQAINIKSKKLISYLLEKGALVNFVNSSWQTASDVVSYNVAMYSDNTREATYTYDTQIGYLDSYLKSHKPDTFAYNEINTQRGGISQPTKESIEETTKQRKQELNLWKEIKSIILKYGAVRIEDVKVDSADHEFSSHLHHRSQYPHNYGYRAHQTSSYTPSYAVTFSNIQENVGAYHSWSRAYTSHQDVYLELFDAVWKGDVKKVKSLTIEKEIGKQAHICSYSNFTHRSPLHIAIEKNNPEMVQLVLDIAFKQFTPMKFKAKKTEEKGAPLINNYDLSVMMRDMRPGQYIDPNSLKVVEDNKEIDHSALVQMNCTTSVTSLLIHPDSKQRNSLLSAVAHNSDKAFKVITDYVNANVDKIIVGTSYEDTPGNHPKKGKKPDFLNSFYHSRGPQNYSAFEYAIVKGNTNFANVLLQHGGLDAAYSIPTPPTPNEEKGEDDMYEGLDVGGKKMDWVREVRESKPKRIHQRTCIHLAAANDQVKSIQYLTLPATEATFKKHTKLESTTDLDLYATDEKHRTALHWAISNKSLEAINYLAKLPKADNQKESMLNTADHDGNTPLIHAVHQGSLEMVDALLAAGANVNLVDKTRGWTALHHAAALHTKEIPDIVKSLLKKADKSVVNVQSKYFKQTPLVIASYHGNDAVVKILIESGKADVHLRDAAGDFALHHAVKQAKSNVVEVLLPKQDKVYNEENGVGFTALDAAAQTLLSRLHSKNTTLSIPVNFNQVYQHVKTVQGETRTLVPSEVVVELTNIILTQTEAEVKEQHERLKAQAGAVKKWNPYRDYDEDSDEESDDDDEDGGLTGGEIHQASVDFAMSCKETKNGVDF